MSVIKKSLISILSVLALLAINVQTASACSCIAPPGPLVALGEADAVFAGKVVRVLRGKGEYGDVLRVTFEVDSYWKGDLGDQIWLETATNSAACGYNFEENTEYLVYGYLSNSNVLSTNICTRTASLDRAQADLSELGDPNNVTVTRSRCGGPTNAAAIQSLVFLFAGILFVRRRKDLPATKGN